MLVAVCVFPCVFSSIECDASSFLFDTAAPPGDSSGFRIRDDFWIFHRFEVTAPTQVTSLGGDFTNFTNADIDVFGAIVQLLSEIDTPKSINLTTSDVLATTLVTVGTSRGLYTSPMDIVLSPGWYALEFGTGAFSASSVSGGGLQLMMQNLTTDLSPQLPVAVNHAASSGVVFDSLQATPRFYVSGAVVPLPATAWLFVSGLLGLVAVVRRSKR
ncbi:MAG: VPLPA-CTERM sorting domain-containing protein [Thiotrichales bacterium]|nr:MAG: VPLPA-CTERM sorting domain-containing protein [Thiotrichales bacterium]